MCFFPENRKLELIPQRLRDLERHLSGMSDDFAGLVEELASDIRQLDSCFLRLVFVISKPAGTARPQSADSRESSTLARRQRARRGFRSPQRGERRNSVSRRRQPAGRTPRRFG